MILAVVSLTKEETDAARQYAVVAHVAVDGGECYSCFTRKEVQ